MIKYKDVAKDMVEVCNKHKLPADSAIKCLVYTATKLITHQFKVSEIDAAEMVSKSALQFREEIKRIERMFSNKG